MTKKDYRLLASMIVRLKNKNLSIFIPNNLDRLDAINEVENELIKELRQENDRFDIEKWEAFKWEAFKEKIQKVNC